MIKKTILSTIAAAATFTIAASAHAQAPSFQVDPFAQGLGQANILNWGQKFEADQISGVSSARVQYTGRDGDAYKYSSVGYIQYTGFSLDSQAINADVTLLNLTGIGYGLYATFTQTFSCSSLLAPNTSCSVDTITLGLYGDPGANNGYNKATLTSDASVTANGAQVHLGDVTFITSGSAGLTKEGGAFQSVNTNFIISPEGQDFFFEPEPFYSFAFSSFNNTTQGLLCSNGTLSGAPTADPATNPCIGATTVAINQEVGNTDFNGRRVPEPSVLALMGLGLLGMTRYRRKQK